MASEGVLIDDEAENSLVSLSDDILLTKLSQDYAEFLTIDADKERHTFNDAVEDILNRLDDFLGTSDMVRSDISLLLNTTLNQIYMKSKEIEKQFERIDRLEAFMVMVRNNVSEMEVAVEKAESDMGTISSLKKAINSLSFPFLSTKPKSPPPPAAAMPKFEPRPIYQTEDYFSHVSSISDDNLRMGGTFSSSQNDTQFDIPQSATTGSVNHHEHLVNVTVDNDRAMQTVDDSASSSACSAEIISEENSELINNYDNSSVTDIPAAGSQADFNSTGENAKSDAGQEKLMLKR